MATKNESKTNPEFIKDKDIDKLIEYLYATRDSFSSWIQSKEASSWAAVIFYFALLYYFNQFIIDKNSALIYDTFPGSIIILLVPILLSYIFFRFIHAHYQQSFYTLLRNKVIKRMIVELISKREVFLIENQIDTQEKFIKYYRKNNEGRF